jgi:hypothetical protein
MSPPSNSRRQRLLRSSSSSTSPPLIYYTNTPFDTLPLDHLITIKRLSNSFSFIHDLELEKRKSVISGIKTRIQSALKHLVKFVKQLGRKRCLSISPQRTKTWASERGSLGGRGFCESSSALGVMSRVRCDWRG